MGLSGMDSYSNQFTIKELAFVQSVSNMFLSFPRRASLIVGHLDQLESVIFSAFILSSMSDTVRLVIQSGSEGTNIVADGLLSIASISDMTGIPRQTVRRKCSDLEARGIIVREQSRLYRCIIPKALVEEMASQVGGIIKINEKLNVK
jgi:hypothetical protein